MAAASEVKISVTSEPSCDSTVHNSQYHSFKTKEVEKLPYEVFNDLSRLPDKPIDMKDGREFGIRNWSPHADLEKSAFGMIPVEFDGIISWRGEREPSSYRPMDWFNELSPIPEETLDLGDGRTIGTTSWQAKGDLDGQIVVTVTGFVQYAPSKEESKYEPML